MTATGNRTSKTKVSIPVIKIEMVAGSKIPSSWDFKYNCRVPSKGSKAYKDMMETLANEPAEFVHRNSGIHVANDKHILDGGHTWLALRDAKAEEYDLSEVFVRVSYYNNLKPLEMAEKSKFLNNKVTPPLRGEKDIMGEWDGLKKSLAKKYEDLYEFRPNTKPSAPFKVDFLVALLHALTGDTAIRSYTGKGILVRLYKDTKYESVIKHINIAIELYSHIVKDIAEIKKFHNLTGVVDNKPMTLPDGSKVNTKIPEGYIWPLFGAFSLALDEEGNWKDSPIEIWKASRTKMVQQLLTDYRKDDVGNRHYNKLGKSREAYLGIQRYLRVK